MGLTDQLNWLTGIPLGIAAFALTVAGAVYADYTSIVGSKHDLSANASIEGGLYVCAYCHGVHAKSGDVIALWNRSNPVTTFTLYSSPTLSNEITQLGDASLVCLSCHDGSTPFDAVGGSSGSDENDMNTHYPGSTAIFGEDLNFDHPVGADIPDRDDYEELSSITSSGLEVFNNKVECSSCHDAHGNGGHDSFLRKDNSGSALCRACHIK